MSNGNLALNISKEKRQYVGDFLDCIVDCLDLTETQHKHIKVPTTPWANSFLKVTTLFLKGP